MAVSRFGPFAEEAIELVAFVVAVQPRALPVLKSGKHALEVVPDHQDQPLLEELLGAAALLGSRQGVEVVAFEIRAEDLDDPLYASGLLKADKACPIRE